MKPDSDIRLAMNNCPYCQTTERQVKAGFNRTRSQRFQCQACRRQYTPEPRPLGYDTATREMALKLYLEGNGFRRIARLLSVNHQSVVNWVTAAHASLPLSEESALSVASIETLEMDELFTFVGSKKLKPTSSRL